MNNSEFLDHLEATIDQPWSDEQTLRLWKLCRYSDTPPMIRQIYAPIGPRGRRRRDHINRARQRLVATVIKRLDTK